MWDSDPDTKLWRAAELVYDFAPAFGTDTANALLQGLPDVSPGPPPAAPSKTIPTIPSIDEINASMILSEDRLFFISIPIGTNDVREWRLVQLDFESSVRFSPSCMQTGKFLFEFYIGHPADWRFNAINQRFWLQHFKESDLLHPDQSHDTHLVKPSSSSRAFAVQNNLLIARKYVHLLHTDTFIHGPFNFATVHNRKTRDRISQVDWQVLATHSHMFRNPIPSFDVPTYSIHVDNGIHFSFNDKHHADKLFSQYVLPDVDHNSDNESLFSDYVSDNDSLFSDVAP